MIMKANLLKKDEINYQKYYIDTAQEIVSTLRDHHMFYEYIGNNPDMHFLHRDALQKIHDTDLSSVPIVEPKLFSKSFFISCSTGQPLFDQTYELGVFRGNNISGESRIVFMGYNPKAALVETHVLWNAEWGKLGEEVDSWDIQIDDISGLREWGNKAVRFIFIYSLLLEAEKTPIVIAKANRIRANRENDIKKRKMKQFTILVCQKRKSIKVMNKRKLLSCRTKKIKEWSL